MWQGSGAEAHIFVPQSTVLVYYSLSYRPRGESDLMVAAFSKDVIDIEE